MDREVLLEIAREYGTPVYVYDLEKIRKQYAKLKKAFEELPFSIHYAVKANANPAVIQTLHQQGSGFDTVSTEEINRLISLGINPEEIVYTPSCPSEQELEKAFNSGVRVHISALEYLPLVAKKFPEKPIGLRLNPDVQISGNMKIATAHAMSKFGIPWARHKELLKTIKKNKIRVETLHIHLGSDVHSLNDLKRGVDFIMQAAEFFPGLKYLDLGSGLKVKYHSHDTEIDLKAYAGYIREKTGTLNQPVKIILEPGKFLTAEAGVFLMRVNIVKHGALKTFAGVNTGFNHMIRPMYYEAYHRIENISNPAGKPKVYDIVGNLCEEDTFARSRKINEIRAGDILALYNAGAYGYVMASHYNLRPLPKEIALDGNKIFEI